MNGTRFSIITLALWLAIIPEAFAASSTRVYSSGILILLFLGFCALVLVAQMIPALITLWGMIKGAVTGSQKEAEAEIGE